MTHMLPSCLQTPTQGEHLDMATRNASAEWQGNLMEGKGNMALGSGAFEGPSRSSRASRKARAPTRRS